MNKASELLKLSIKADLDSNDDFSLISIPKHLMDIKKLCLDRSSSIDEIIPAIEKDPGLTSFLIRMANSVHYIGQRNAISSVREACIRMGLGEVGNYAILYATRIMHEAKVSAPVIRDKINLNLKRSQSVATRAVNAITLLKEQGLKFDMSEVQTTVSLYFASNLGVYSKADKMSHLDLSINDLGEVCRALNPELVQALLSYVGYLEPEINRIAFGSKGHLSWLDIVHKEIYFESSDMVDVQVKERLNELKLIDSK